MNPVLACPNEAESSGPTAAKKSSFFPSTWLNSASLRLITEPRAKFKMLSLILRVPERVTLLSGRRVATFKEHNAVSLQYGKVVVGKFGLRPGPKTAASLQNDVAEDLKPSLYMVYKQDGQFSAYRGEIESVSYAKPMPEYDNLIPDYYSELESQPNFWITVIGGLAPSGLFGLNLASSGRPVLEVLRETRTAAMLAN